MYEELYLVSKRELDLIDQAEEKEKEEKPLLSYSEVYNNIVKAKEEDEKPKSAGKWLNINDAKKATPKLLRRSISYGIRIKKRVNKQI